MPKQLLLCNAEKRMRQAAVADLSTDRKSTRLNSSHTVISYAVFCLKKKKNKTKQKKQKTQNKQNNTNHNPQQQTTTKTIQTSTNKSRATQHTSKTLHSVNRQRKLNI